MHPVKSEQPYRFYMFGYGLIEMMISVVLVAGIMTVACTVFTAHEVQNNRAEQYYLVQQQAHNLLTIMQRELSQAGYKNNIEEANPFLYSGAQIFILNPSKDCIVYRYDRNEDGIFAGENFGFRLHNGGLQRRKGSEVGCEGGLGWEMLSDTANIEITQLHFTSTQRLYALPHRVKSYVTIALSIRHRQLTDIELNFSRNSSARAFYSAI